MLQLWKVRNKIDKKLNIVFAEIDIETLEKVKAADICYSEVSKYPGVSIDLSLLVDKMIRYEIVADYIREYHSEYLQNFYLVDIFEDDKLLPGQKSITVRFEFSSMDRTLEGKEIQVIVSEILVILAQNGIKIRK